MHYVRQIIWNVSRCIFWPILQCTILVWTQIWMGFLASSRREPTQSVKTILGQSCRISRCYIHKSLSHRARFLLYIWQRIFSALCQRDDTSTKPRWQSSSPIFGKNPQITFEIQGSKTAFKNTIWPRASSQVVKTSPYILDPFSHQLLCPLKMWNVHSSIRPQCQMRLFSIIFKHRERGSFSSLCSKLMSLRCKLQTENCQVGFSVFLCCRWAIFLRAKRRRWKLCWSNISDELLRKHSRKRASAAQQRRLPEPLKAHMVVENQVILGCPRAGILQNWSSWQMLAQLTF